MATPYSFVKQQSKKFPKRFKLTEVKDIRQDTVIYLYGLIAINPYKYKHNFYTSNDTNNNATTFITLIIGLMAGPAVSLYGSPTVSPVTAA